MLTDGIWRRGTACRFLQDRTTPEGRGNATPAKSSHSSDAAANLSHVMQADYVEMTQRDCGNMDLRRKWNVIAIALIAPSAKA